MRYLEGKVDGKVDDRWRTGVGEVGGIRDSLTGSRNQKRS